MITIKTAKAVTQALMLCEHNINKDVILQHVYGDALGKIEGPYYNEKLKILNHSLLFFYGQLDREHRAKLVNLALEKYCVEAFEPRCIQ